MNEKQIKNLCLQLLSYVNTSIYENKFNQKGKEKKKAQLVLPDICWQLMQSITI